MGMLHYYIGLPAQDRPGRKLPKYERFDITLAKIGDATSTRNPQPHTHYEGGLEPVDEHFRHPHFGELADR